MRKLSDNKITIVLISSLLLLTGCGERQQYIPELLEPVNAGVNFEKVQRGDISDTKIYDGYIEPAVTKCAFDTVGKIATLQAGIGDEVQEGQVLATLNAGDIDENISDLKREIDYTTASYNLTCRAMALEYKSNEVSLEKLKLKKDTRGISIKEIQQEKLKLKQQYEAVKAELQIDGYNRQIAGYESDRGNVALTAPVSGKVISTGGYVPGDSVNRNDIIVYIENPGSYTVVTRQGQENEFKFANDVVALVDGEEIPLTFLPHTSRENRLAKSQGFAQTYSFQTTSNLTGMAYGTYAPVMISGIKLKNVLFVPKGAVFTDGDTTYVYRNKDGNKEYQEVEIGTERGGKVEIRKGLSEGEEVYVKE